MRDEKRPRALVTGVDLKHSKFSPTEGDEFHIADLQNFGSCLKAAADVDGVYHLAFDMGGVGYIITNHALLMHNNILINSHMMEAT